jgi:UPF0755 protein
MQVWSLRNLNKTWKFLKYHFEHDISLRIATFIVGIFFYIIFGLTGYFVSSGPLAEELNFEVRRGRTLSEISRKLYQKGIIRSKKLFEYGVYFQGLEGDLKAGDYILYPGITPSEITNMIVNAKGRYYKITFPEGLTNHQIFLIMEDAPFLRKDEYIDPMEGTLFPDTYTVSKGTRYSTLVHVMQKEMKQLLKDLWQKRKAGLPFAYPFEALTLASIVEREALLKREMPMIAGVYINRLKKGMRLQADPTAIYGITKGTGILERRLRGNDMRHDNMFNTYRIDGLPPTPIAAPSQAALEAVLIHPAETDAIFFVADGKGGHVFSKKFSDHNKNIKALVQKLRSRTTTK